MMIAPSSTQVLAAIPTDYGPDPSTPFTRALTLPASERPPTRELRKLLGRAGSRNRTRPRRSCETGS